MRDKKDFVAERSEMRIGGMKLYEVIIVVIICLGLTAMCVGMSMCPSSMDYKIAMTEHLEETWGSCWENEYEVITIQGKYDSKITDHFIRIEVVLANKLNPYDSRTFQFYMSRENPDKDCIVFNPNWHKFMEELKVKK